jgi:SAM-dependent methyltransferase
MPEMTGSVNVQEIMQKIRARIRDSAPARNPVSVQGARGSPDWAALEKEGLALEDTSSLVGQLPPEPPTFRGRTGALFVKIVRRALFWYTPPIVRFQAAVTLYLRELLAATKSVADNGRQSSEELDLVNRRVSELKTETERLAKIVEAQQEEIRTMVESLRKGFAGELEGMSRALGAEAMAREELARRVDAEGASRASLEQALAQETSGREELARRIDTEGVARASLGQALAAEIAARESLAEIAHQLEAGLRQRDSNFVQLRAEVINQNRRISILIEEARKRLPAPLDQTQLSVIAGERNHALDALYVSFEDRFRGTRADIKERFRVYLPLIEDQRIRTEGAPVLDLGCGRGEWLELLAEHKLPARGIDTNRVLLGACREAGLNVEEADLLDYLKTQPDKTLGAVTGFHIIEHLAFDILTRVFDETVRVLKPGGIAIFETPNPENVLVGSHNFYLDFTHRNPLPSLTMQFILEAHGLCDVRVLNLHPYPDSSKLQDDGSEITMRFNQYFYGPQDYAVIGRKV